MSDTDIARLLSEAVTQLNADDISAAETSLQRVLDSSVDAPQARMLMGVVRLHQKRPDEAEMLFQETLQHQPGQPTTLYYLGNAQRDKGALVDAVQSYRKALHARPDYPDAQLALGACLRAQGQLAEAKSLYQRAMAHTPGSAEAASGLGGVLNDLAEHAEAECVLIPALKFPAPPDVIARIENDLGIAKMADRRFAEALPHYERAIVLMPEYVEAEKNRARALEHLNRPERAAASYRSVLTREPLDLKTHLLLNELLHRAGRDDEMLESYDRASRTVPSSPLPFTAKGDQLLLLERPDEAAVSYRRALRLTPDHIAAHIGLSRALHALNEPEAAIKGLQTAKENCADDPDLDTALAYALLRAGDTAKALSLTQSAIAMAPHHQPALAVLGLCYRARNDAREDALFGYERFVQIFDLEPPPGYDSIAAFHQALRDHLEELHGQTREFFSQTLRGGTRTVEDILGLRHPLRDALRHRITEAMSRYIATMAPNADHPFVGRRHSGAFRLSGSWSSRMHGGGYHVNHIHNGWISSVYYVDVPDIAAAPDSHQGWLKFGEPSADLGFQNGVRRLVQPKPGRLVLFPSYLWHGTVPFDSNETRMTIAFDAIPFTGN